MFSSSASGRIALAGVQRDVVHEASVKVWRSPNRSPRVPRAQKLSSTSAIGLLAVFVPSGFWVASSPMMPTRHRSMLLVLRVPMLTRLLSSHLVQTLFLRQSLTDC